MNKTGFTNQSKAKCKTCATVIAAGTGIYDNGSTYCTETTIYQDGDDTWFLCLPAYNLRTNSNHQDIDAAYLAEKKRRTSRQ
jgi:hypothetical protein